MSGATSKRIRTLSATVFVLGMITAAFAFTLNQVRKPKLVLAYTMVSKRTFTPSDGGKPRHEVTMVRYQKSNGMWKGVVTYFNPDGTVYKTTTTFGQPGRGVFQLDEGKRQISFISPMEQAVAELPLFDLRNDPRFIKEASVLGYTTLVLRDTEEDGSGDYTEDYHAPALRNLSIKTVAVSERGTSVLEPVELKVGEPDESEFNSLPDWKINYDLYQEKIQALEDSGRHEVADQMRQELQRRLQQKPDRR
ncbi:MAG: hypothetical protein WCF57_24475 [Pyrinomonadaceae bacterium]